MGRKKLSSLMFLMLVAALLLASGALSRSAPEASAAPLLQGVPRLDGVRIYFSEANGAASRFDRGPLGLSRFAGLLRLLGAELYTLEWHRVVPPDADLLVIAGPTQDLSAEQVARLWLYISDGGRVLLLADPVAFGSRAFDWRTGLFRLLVDDLGVRGRPDVVVTEGTRAAPVFQPPAAPGEPTVTPAPPQEVFALITDFLAEHRNVEHPITAALEGPFAFYGARSLEIAPQLPAGVTISPLLFSFGNYFGERAFAQYERTGQAEYHPTGDTQRDRLPLAAAITDSRSGLRMVLIGDREFATNGGGLQTSPAYSRGYLYPDNARFLLNAVVWLLETDAPPVSLEFATPAPTGSPTPQPSPTPTPVPPTATPEQPS